VVEHFEPLILIGTDVLTDSRDSCKFCYVGLHPEKRTGVIVIKDSKGNMVETPLASWPLNGTTRRAPNMKPPAEPFKLNLRRRTKVPNVHDGAREDDKPKNTALSLLALMQNRGKCL
jgi:hypothetical protein